MYGNKECEKEGSKIILPNDVYKIEYLQKEMQIVFKATNCSPPVASCSFPSPGMSPNTHLDHRLVIICSAPQLV